MGIAYGLPIDKQRFQNVNVYRMFGAFPSIDQVDL